MANIDLQQYDGTASFPATADVGTAADPMLLPTDGPIVTADSNLTDEAPVNSSLKRSKDLLLGIRDAIFGDRAGAARKTVNRLQADGVGGQTVTVGAGQVAAENDVRSLNGDVRAENGNVFADLFVQAGSAVAQRMRHYAFGLEWIATVVGAGDANPPWGTAVPNKCTAKSILKHYMRVSSVAGAFTVRDGLGDWAVSIVDVGAMITPRYRYRFSLPTVFDDVRYAPIVQFLVSNATNLWEPFVMLDTLNAGQFDVAFYDRSTTLWLNLTAGDADIAIHVSGQQTT